MKGPNVGTYWVRPGKLLAGPNPSTFREERTRENIARLLEVGVNVFVDLTEPDERESYQPLLPAGVIFHRLSIPDFDIPTVDHMRTILDTIDGALIQGRVVYVHCMGGIGRTGTTVGCYLVRHGLTGEEALREIARLLHDGSPETPEQRAMILNWREKPQ